MKDTTKEVLFDPQLEYLVEFPSGKKYDGKRAGIVKADSNRFVTPESALDDAVADLKGKAKKMGADAYEIVCTMIEESGEEYVAEPYKAGLIAILYKN